MRRRKDDHQKLLPFDAPAADAPPPAAPAAAVSVASYQPTSEALATLIRLQAWLTDPNTGRMTPLGEEAMHALQQALVHGRNGWLLAAEDTLEALAVRNGQHQGDDIPASHRPAGPDFQQTIEDVLNALQERVVGRAR